MIRFSILGRSAASGLYGFLRPYDDIQTSLDGEKGACEIWMLKDL